jgi:fumarate reductase subunit D
LGKKTGRQSKPILILVLAIALPVATIQGHEKGRVIEYIFTLILEGGIWKVGK